MSDMNSTMDERSRDDKACRRKSSSLMDLELNIENKILEEQRSNIINTTNNDDENDINKSAPILTPIKLEMKTLNDINSTMDERNKDDKACSRKSSSLMDLETNIENKILEEQRSNIVNTTNNDDENDIDRSAPILIPIKLEMKTLMDLETAKENKIVKYNTDNNISSSNDDSDRQQNSNIDNKILQQSNVTNISSIPAPNKAEIKSLMDLEGAEENKILRSNINDGNIIISNNSSEQQKPITNFTINDDNIISSRGSTISLISLESSAHRKVVGFSKEDKQKEDGQENEDNEGSETNIIISNNSWEQQKCITNVTINNNNIINNRGSSITLISLESSAHRKIIENRSEDSKQKDEQEEGKEVAGDEISDTGRIYLEDEGLAVAIPIQTDSIDEDEIYYADEYYPEDEGKNRFFRNRNIKKIVLIMTFFFAVLIIVTISAILTSIKNKHATIQTEEPIPERTQIITNRIIDISPNALIKNTPQYAALQWILHDDPSQINANDIYLLQRYILALLYFSTNGQYWYFCSYNNAATNTNCTFSEPTYDSNNEETFSYYTSTQFLSNTSECIWFGIHCNDKGYVSQLLLYDNNLTSTAANDNGAGIPSELYHLINLELLWLHSNYLSGTVPSIILQMESLQELHLQGNLLYGPVLQDSTNNNNNISTAAASSSDNTTSFLRKRSNLQLLSLASNSFTGTISNTIISNSMYLIGLYLFNNLFTGSIPNSMGDLSGPGYIYLYNNILTGSIPSSVMNLTTLQHLWLDDNNLNGSLPIVGHMRSLTMLKLNKNELNGSLPKELFNCTSLNILYLDFNYFSGTLPQDIDNLKDLQELNLGTNKFSGNIPPNIGNLVNLQQALFHYNDFTGIMPNQICNLTVNHSLEMLYADCLDKYQPPQISCSCCTDCCDKAENICNAV